MAWKLGGVAVPLALEPVTCSSSGDNSDSATAEPTCSEFAITSEAAGETVHTRDGHGGRIMKRQRRPVTGVRLIVLTTIVLVAAACSASDETVSDSSDTRSPTTVETVATTSAGNEAVPNSSTTATPESTGDSGAGDYSVVMVAKIDELTASSTLASLEDAGIGGFVMEGTADEGFDVYRSSLTYDEAQDVLVEIFTAPDVYGGLIFETVNLP